MKILDKLKELGLQESDIKDIQTYIQEAVDTKAQLKIQEKVAELEKVNSEFIAQKVQTLSEAKLERKLKQVNEELSEFKEKVMGSLDQYIKIEMPNIINECLGHDALDKLAKYEIYEPIVNGIAGLFEEKYVPVKFDEDGRIKQLKSDLGEKDRKLDKVIAENVDLVAKMDKLKAKLLLESASYDLPSKKKQQLMSLFENAGYDEIRSKIKNTVAILTEDADASLEDDADGGTTDVNNDFGGEGGDVSVDGGTGDAGTEDFDLGDGEEGTDVDITDESGEVSVDKLTAKIAELESKINAIDGGEGDLGGGEEGGEFDAGGADAGEGDEFDIDFETDDDFDLEGGEGEAGDGDTGDSFDDEEFR